MLIEPIESDEQIFAFHDAYLAGMTGVSGPFWTAPRFRAYVTESSPAVRMEAWAAVEDGRVVAGYGLRLTLDDNTHVAGLFPLVVRPEWKRRGLGSRLLEHAVGRARAAGRSLLLGEAPAVGDGSAFAVSSGATIGVREARRVLDLGRADWDEFARMLPEADGYVLERWRGPAGEDLLPDLAAVLDGMNDAPRAEGVEPTRPSLERVRADEKRMPFTGEDCYSMLARRASDGAPAGLTRIFLDSGRADRWGHQGDTTVLKEHRGHRLGLLLKLANLIWLHESEPHIDRIVTWNATANRHMLAINEAMGFELLDEWNEWRLPV